MGNFWFAIAMVEFVILLFVFVPKFFSNMPKKLPDEIKEDGSGRMGIIKKLCYSNKVMTKYPITIFEIHEKDGTIFLAGVDGENFELFNESTIEFWPSSEIAATLDIPTTIRNTDRTKSARLKELKFYSLEKYRIIFPEETIATNSGEDMPDKKIASCEKN